MAILPCIQGTYWIWGSQAELVPRALLDIPHLSLVDLAAGLAAQWVKAFHSSSMEVE